MGLGNINKIHFIGIAGIGMSALAEILIAKGKVVTGSDLRPNNLTEKLAREGAVIYSGHSGENVTRDTDLVVKSSCIRDDNPEMLSASRMGIPIMQRGDLLDEVMKMFPVSIAVTGTHGKTTTSALVAHILELSGKDPTAIIGGELPSINGNAKCGSGDIVIAEVDESDGSFRKISSTYAVITNIEREHIENYGSMEKLLKSYGEFIGNISATGKLFYNGEDGNVPDLFGGLNVKKIDFGAKRDFCFSCRRCSYDKAISFDLYISGKFIGKITSSLVGMHNVMNILGAIAVCSEIGLAFQEIAQAVKSFSGVKRRFEQKAKIGDIEIIEDYAHHPTELKAVIKAAGDYGEGRVVAVFQPHRYSRTHDLADEFLNCFNGADVLVLTDVYSADEENAEGVGIEDIYGKMDRTGFKSVELIEKEKIADYLGRIVLGKDIILILGAGDIRDISGDVINAVRKKTGNVKP